MIEQHEPLLGWPGWSTFLKQQWWVLIFTIFYLVFFVGASRLADGFTRFHHVHMDWEMHIPFRHEWVLIYLSVHVLLGLAPFIFRSYEAMKPLVLTLCAMMVLASVCFLIYPVQTGFNRPPQPGFWFNLADRMNMNHNYLPSLHAGFSMAAALAYGRRCRWIGKCVFYGWAVAITLSTLFIHEHQMLDLLAGWILAWASMRWLYPLFTTPNPNLSEGKSCSKQQPQYSV